MPSTLLNLATPTTGTESGTWGDLVNNGLTSYLDIAIAGQLAITITTTDVTLTNTSGTNAATGITSTTAQYAILNITGAKTAARNLNLPASSRQYLINNAGTGGFLLTVRGSTPTTGVKLIDGEKAVVAWNGTDYVKIASTPFNMGIGSGNIATNVVYGKGSLAANTTGYESVAVGNSCLASNTTGENNVAIGSSALFSNTTGGANVAIGAFAMYANITSGGHVAIGGSALVDFNGSGSSNIAIGLRTGRFTSGGQNIAMGQDALSGNGSSSSNIAIGAASMSGSGTLGERNVALGLYALNTLTTGSNNIAIGYDALKNVTTGTGNTAIGPSIIGATYAPVFNPTTQDNRFCMGSTAVTNAYIQVAWTVVSDARDKTDFAPVPHGLDFVCKLKPTAYRYKENREATEGHGPLRYGFKAQEVLAEEGANPVIVDNEDPEKLRFNDQSMIAVLVNAIKEQTQIIKTLSDRVAQLESKA